MSDSGKIHFKFIEDTSVNFYHLRNNEDAAISKFLVPYDLVFPDMEKISVTFRSGYTSVKAPGKKCEGLICRPADVDIGFFNTI